MERRARTGRARLPLRKSAVADRLHRDRAAPAHARTKALHDAMVFLRRSAGREPAASWFVHVSRLLDLARGRRPRGDPRRFRPPRSTYLPFEPNARRTRTARASKRITAVLRAPHRSLRVGGRRRPATRASACRRHPRLRLDAEGMLRDMRSSGVARRIVDVRPATELGLIEITTMRVDGNAA